MKKNLKTSLKTIGILFFVFLGITSCKTKKDYFYGDGINGEVYYKDTQCSYSHVSFWKKRSNDESFKNCMKYKYSFTGKEIRYVKSYIFDSNEGSQKKMNINIYMIDEGQFVNTDGYGIYYAYNSNSGFSSFYFLRTEHEIFFFSCKNINKIEELLFKSEKIDFSLKNNILKYIKKRCQEEGFQKCTHCV
ncbi:hypothetical protein [Aureivirga sp. CE67]|uniref:hypothetical protein n=1 Tax=Aureivirga sp. CE67 TaxID=1788983 RepID=UPI0018CBEF30|nr:hypothetical protein [Aureivirga sp. CE67]